MLKVLVAVLTIMAACTPNASTALAQPYPVCIRGCDFGAAECTFSSYQQCQAAAAGRPAWCDINPDYRPVNASQLLAARG